MALFGGRTRAGNPDIFAILDVGSSKVVCFIGREEPGVGVRILGAGYHASAGLRAGAVIDMEAAENTIRHAVEKAERAAGLAISSVIVNVSTRSIRSRHIHVDTKFSSAEVADRDLQRVIDTALSEFNEPDQAILHAFPLNWAVDEERGIRDPRGMFGQKLGVDMHFVTAGVGVLRNLAHCIERCHLRIAGMVASPYAAGIGVLVEDEFDLGVTLIDMGAGITTAAVFRDRTLAFVDGVGVGGQNVTSDIARGLTTPFEAAERIKTIYGSALDSPDDDGQMVPCPPMGAQDELHHEPLTLLTSIVRSRIEETFEILRDRFKAAGIEEFAGRRIVLTGGAAQLSGVAQLAEYTFKKRVRVGRPHGLLGLPDTMAGPDFAVASGLIKQVFQDKREAISGPPDLSGARSRTRRYAGGGFSKSLKWFRENF
ncbi:MAG: cell division protein FtsA [Robiginitomaculum sp.]|nr:MAG: cell division protein FtsA [Robiginitomaculum sp.]